MYSQIANQRDEVVKYNLNACKEIVVKILDSGNQSSPARSKMRTMKVGYMYQFVFHSIKAFSRWHRVIHWLVNSIRWISDGQTARFSIQVKSSRFDLITSVKSSYDMHKK